MISIKHSIREHEYWILTLLTVIFIGIRLLGVNQPLHQDEYKWPLIANPATAGDTSIPHPPLSEFIYREAGKLVGYNVHFRFVPLFFGTLSLILFYFVLKRRLGQKAAWIGASMFTISYFSILASLMVDVDGAIMPFFFLFMLWAYDCWFDSRKKGWLTLALIAAIGGLFIKVSFVLAVAAVAGDFIWQKRGTINWKMLLTYLAYAAGFVIVFVLLLVLSQKFFPFFNLHSSLVYWEHFASVHRNWFQTMIQVVKALLYLSPFLVLVPLFLSRKHWDAVIPFLLYIGFGFIFYIVLFDFSTGALDRYLQFLVIPLVAIVSAVIVSTIETIKKKNDAKCVFLGSLIALALFLFQLIPQSVPALYPKSAWISRILSLKWNFLYPFSGGSGPLGFYVSFGFLAMCWIVSIALVIAGLLKKDFRRAALLMLIPIGLIYTAVFAEEYLLGYINGSAARLLPGAVSFITADQNIHMPDAGVIVYNDNGGWDVMQTGKYDKRLYTSPDFNLTDKITTLNTHKEFYFELNVPRIDPTSIYRAYLDSCKMIYQSTDRYVSAAVYDCRGVKDVSITTSL